MKNKIEINQLKKMANDTLEVFMIDYTKTTTKLKVSMFQIDYKMHQSIDLSMDL